MAKFVTDLQIEHVMLFSEKIRNLRKESGLLQRDLAKAIGVDVPMYSRYEHGERHPKREQVIKLARQLKTDAGELVALWLAEAAMSTIGHDKMSARASQLLRETLDKDAPVEEPAPAITIEAPIATQPAIDPSILKAPAMPPEKRNMVAMMGKNMMPHYEVGDARQVMQRIEDESIDCIVTTPPYWHLKRHGAELLNCDNIKDYTDELLRVMAEAWRVLKPGGSLWLNMGDAYGDNSLMALPWRVAIGMIDLQGWILRNDVVWNKQQTPFDNASNHLRNVHEFMFHFVKSSEFYYDDQQLRQAFNMTKNKGEGTRSGITGEKYLKRIRTSAYLNAEEKRNAELALSDMLAKAKNGEIPDFRLFLRIDGNNIGDPQSEKDQAIKEKGFYIQVHNRSGNMPDDIWEISPAKSDIEQYVIAPEMLYRLPIAATCPKGGIVLDPFCGTGTACKVAHDMNRRSIGIDINGERLRRAKGRVEQKPLSLF